MNTTNRKRVLKVAIEWAVYPWDNATGNSSVYLGIIRDQTAPAPSALWRRKVLSGTSSETRCVWKNLGQCRQMQFIIAYKGRSNFSPQALEVEIAQGTK